MASVVFDLEVKVATSDAEAGGVNASDQDRELKKISELGHGSWCLAVDANLEGVTIPFGAKVSTLQQFTSGLESNGGAMLVKQQQERGDYTVLVLAEAFELAFACWCADAEFALVMMLAMPLVKADIMLQDDL